ncbi:MAG: hypothetical protein V1844_22450 [Pseudomonadota bacterium]
MNVVLFGLPVDDLSGAFGNGDTCKKNGKIREHHARHKYIINRVASDRKTRCGNVENISLDSFLNERMLKYCNERWRKKPPGITDFFCRETADMFVFRSEYDFL